MFRKLFSWIRKPLPNVAYLEMRSQMFNLKPEKVGIKRADGQQVWGVITEFTIDDGYVTMVSLANGRTYMYFSTGDGILGAGDYSMVSIASAELVKTAERFVSLMKPTKERPFPSLGHTRFYLLTYSGLYTKEVLESQMSGEHTNTMYGLYAFTQNVITQIRMISGKSRS